MVDSAGFHDIPRRALLGLFPQRLLNWRESRFYGRHGEIELHLTRFLCRRDAEAVDVGAHSGSYVHHMRRHAGGVIAYEPIPRLASALRRKFPTRVAVEAVALSDRRGKIELRVPVLDGVDLEGCATVSSGASTAYPQYRSIVVPMERLDDVYHGRAGFLKIAVEGHEQAVLDGAVRTIERDRPRILIQIDERLAPRGIATARGYFADLGYDGYFVHNYCLKPLARFLVDRLQHPANLPDLIAPLDTRTRFGRYVCKFIFLPREEPPATLRGMAEQLSKLRARLTD